MAFTSFCRQHDFIDHPTSQNFSTRILVDVSLFESGGFITIHELRSLQRKGPSSLKQSGLFKLKNRVAANHAIFSTSVSFACHLLVERYLRHNRLGCDLKIKAFAAVTESRRLKFLAFNSLDW
ncbi:hypothetical protein PHYBLDRAFT_139890 [Phycomyces blakesleeanus NRRL 1555(-)]|uniref:Uncharacterized protein n=1 Tax=Phycomyces blakesleeanus (strain ATCC 8743b / DSM 1359 / FGSC 10004 / NBRC 33097 / NRRL 1555) TaxID=763407 RepID=A0A167QLA7_PHYB8|nr:hypothetical protein PHYBLDRAFT_139890 [Phycomyces blakesleeanus NRRL 1555(-)]OAD79878.1 hypothetical protein PHYBLDRAFT_139890 [Phycomyces blakesleeanus NRRL 1555(-)]|eukprot:XP_018297918.1 hypothetical protein PHYBLDRAFT_139890 [Phycomyces blakesleeanus NRRL 1555(-)]